MKNTSDKKLIVGGKVVLTSGGEVLLTSGWKVLLTSGGDVLLTSGEKLFLTSGWKVILTSGGEVLLTGDECNKLDVMPDGEGLQEVHHSDHGVWMRCHTSAHHNPVTTSRGTSNTTVR